MRGWDSLRRGLRDSRPAQWYAHTVQRLRWVIVLAWVVGLGAAMMLLPNASTSSDNLGGLLPADSPAVSTEQRSLASFSLPLLSNTTVVLTSPDGLTPLTQADVVLYALAYDQRLKGLSPPYPQDRVLGALPVVDPGNPTTAVTYLYFSPNSSIADRTRLAGAYVDHFRGIPGVHGYVTGLVPAQQADARYLSSRLLLLELATLALITFIVAVVFRSVLAPVFTLVVAVAGYLLDLRVLGSLLRVLHIAVPGQLEPLIVALMLGIVTDYSVFFMVDMRDRLLAGDDARTATHRAIAGTAPIVLVAGLTVTAGTASLSAAQLELFRAFGPGLAITVLVGLFASVTLLPAVLSIVGRWLFWPSGLRPRPRTVHASRTVGWVSSRTGARRVGAAGLIVLVVLALPLTHLRLSLSFTEGLPAADPVRQGARAVSPVFARGITAPTEVLVDSPDIGSQRPQLVRLEQLMVREPGVARVLGPADDPVPGANGIVYSPNGHTARLLVVFDSDPLGPGAIASLRALQARAPTLLQQAGLRDGHLAATGDTAIAAEVAALTGENLRRILLVAFALELILLIAYLRAVVAPLVLLALSGLTVASALGLTVLVFQDVLGVSGLIFFAPFATAVLLLALGSDYNVIGIGSIWEEAARRPLPDALRLALPRTTRAIVTAGITLAGSLGMVAVVPLLAFREIAFTMAVGLLIDTFLVRSLLTPSALTLLGRFAEWPGHRLDQTRSPDSAAPVPPVAAPPAVQPAKSPVAVRTASTAHPGSGAGRTLSGRLDDAVTRALPGRWRAPSRRQLVSAGVLLVAVVGVLWLGDYLARVGAQSEVSHNLAQSVRQEGTPDVHIQGAFFLPQVIRGRYDEVDVTLHGVQGDQLRIDRVDATLRGVHLQLHDVLTGSVSTVPIDSTQERLQLSYSDINTYLAATGRPVELAAGDPVDGVPTVRITGRLSILGRQVSAGAEARLTPDEGAIDIVPTDIDTGSTTVDGLGRALLRERLTIAVPTGSLPFDQQLTGITPGDGGIVVTGAGSSIVLTP